MHQHRLAAITDRCPPPMFALVMATGIVGIATGHAGLREVALALQLLATAALAFCWAVLATRVAMQPRALLADFADHARAPGHFTAVAGTAVVGSGAMAFPGTLSFSIAMLSIATTAWLVLTYAIFGALVIARDKPPLAQCLHGGWLLAVVAIQSLCVLATLLAPDLDPAARAHLELFALCAWLVGIGLYACLATLLLYRAVFLPFAPGDLTPGWWITMGAMAISTLAGAGLVGAAGSVPLLADMLPALRAGSLLCWAIGTWWIPLLLVLHVWRHVVRGMPLHYDFGQWSAVFPLGMYSVASGTLGSALQLGFLMKVATAFAWIALTAWSATAIGWLRRLVATQGAVRTTAEGGR
ncbi:tellurite resistance/C4-dicarboxylate transporter family protein [Ramlibacter sp. MMS24-I3-19]|uniref:tellurite resistance/C4-dicarboxylate transporter family protein n=1 Tax=Ramlibacter sp. MMS24-I3-19 TaxID=3416606 RepID=UPI003D01B893